MNLFNWGKKKSEPINSAEFEKLNQKIVSLVGDMDILTNKVSIFGEMAKGNRAKIGKIARDEIVKESEKELKDEIKYI